MVRLISPVLRRNSVGHRVADKPPNHTFLWHCIWEYVWSNQSQRIGISWLSEEVKKQFFQFGWFFEQDIRWTPRIDRMIQTIQLTHLSNASRLVQRKFSWKMRETAVKLRLHPQWTVFTKCLPIMKFNMLYFTAVFYSTCAHDVLWCWVFYSTFANYLM